MTNRDDGESHTASFIVQAKIDKERGAGVDGTWVEGESRHCGHALNGECRDVFDAIVATAEMTAHVKGK